jgi:hypothetical protein
VEAFDLALDPRGFRHVRVEGGLLVRGHPARFLRDEFHDAVGLIDLGLASFLECLKIHGDPHKQSRVGSANGISRT